jgi:hypothetical protein
MLVISGLAAHQRLGHWGYLVIFLGAMLESAAFLGLLIPGESLVLVAGFLAAQRVLDLDALIWVVAHGATLGDSIGYELGRRRPSLARALLHGVSTPSASAKRNGLVHDRNRGVKELNKDLKSTSRAQTRLEEQRNRQDSVLQLAVAVSKRSERPRNRNQPRRTAVSGTRRASALRCRGSRHAQLQVEPGQLNAQSELHIDERAILTGVAGRPRLMVPKIAEVTEQRYAGGERSRRIDLEISSMPARTEVVIGVVRARVDVFVSGADESLGVEIARLDGGTREQIRDEARFPGNTLVERARITAVELPAHTGNLRIDAHRGREPAEKDAAGMLIVEAGLQGRSPIAQRLAAITVVRQQRDVARQLCTRGAGSGKRHPQATQDSAA